MLEFHIEIDTVLTIPVVRVAGDIDIHTCSKLNEVLARLINEGQKILILDLENTSYIDSTGLGTIAHSAHILDKSSGKVFVISSQPTIKKIFDVSGLSKRNITLFSEETTALAQLV